MMYSIQNYWDFCDRPVLLEVETRCFGKLICFHHQVNVGRRQLLSWAP
jgi:hypothetical protein